MSATLCVMYAIYIPKVLIKIHTENISVKNIVIAGNRQPIILPTFLCLPLLVSGTPVFLEILFFRPGIPAARFHENEIPNFLPIMFIFPSYRPSILKQRKRQLKL